MGLATVVCAVLLVPLPGADEQVVAYPIACHKAETVELIRAPVQRPNLEEPQSLFFHKHKKIYSRVIPETGPSETDCRENSKLKGCQNG